MPNRAPLHQLEDVVVALPVLLYPALAIGEGFLRHQVRLARGVGVGDAINVATLDKHGLQGLLVQAEGARTLVVAPSLRNAAGNLQDGRCLQEEDNQQEENHHVHRLEGLRQRILLLVLAKPHFGDPVRVAGVDPNEEHDGDEAETRELLEEIVQHLPADLIAGGIQSMPYRMLPRLEDRREQHDAGDLDEEDGRVDAHLVPELEHEALAFAMAVAMVMPLSVATGLGGLVLVVLSRVSARERQLWPTPTD
mmetsp:Transcript_116663/g.161951  ORF Transcript_116663/g.161951 Transcript_116663/m.161951 type:complete len:251 (+) Transcript_116663:461-1213(+)